MGGRIVLGALLIALGAAPAAQAVSATLTSPPNGATYYTGTQFTAAVPWSGSYSFAPCSGNNFFIGKVLRWDRPSPPAGDWPSNGGSKETTLSGTNNLFPGTYYFKASAQCGLMPTVYSAISTIRVISGAPPAPPTGTKPVYPKVKKTKCMRKGKRVLCPQQKALVSRLVKAAEQTAKQRVPLKKAAAKRKAAKTPAQRDAAGKAIEAAFKPIADAYIDLLVLSKKPLPTVKVNLPRSFEEWKRLLLPIAQREAEKKWGDKRLYKVGEFAIEADKTLALTSKYAAETDRQYVSNPAVRAELDALAPAFCSTTSYSQCGAEGKAAVVSHSLVQTGQEHKLHNQASELAKAGANVVYQLPRGF